MTVSYVVWQRQSGQGGVDFTSAGGVGQQRPGQPTVVVETTTGHLSSLPSRSWRQTRLRQATGGTILVMVGQAAVVTVVVVVSTGHPEGMADEKKVGCSFWAVQWIGLIMLGVEGVSYECFR